MDTQGARNMTEIIQCPACNKILSHLGEYHVCETPDRAGAELMNQENSDLRDKIKDLEKKLTWISCSDRLPTKYGRYVIKYCHSSVEKVFIADWDYPEKGGMWTNQLPDVEIIAWRDEVF